MLPFSLVASVTSVLGGLIVTKTKSYRPVLWVSYAIYTLGMGLMTMLDAKTSTALQEIYILIPAIGLGCIFQTPLIALTAAMPASQMATSTAAMALTRNASGTIGITVAGSIFNSNVLHRIARIQGYTVPGNNPSSNLRDLVHIMPADLRAEIIEAYAQALRLVWIIFTPIVGIGFLATLGVKSYSLNRKTVTHKDAEKMTQMTEKPKDEEEAVEASSANEAAVVAMAAEGPAAGQGAAEEAILKDTDIEQVSVPVETYLETPQAGRPSTVE